MATKPEILAEVPFFALLDDQKCGLLAEPRSAEESTR